MRLRRKKNLEQRLEACQEVLIVREGYDFYQQLKNQGDFAKKKANLVNFKQKFGNDHPVHLEIGCGKGGFVCQIAKKCPNINFVAVEKLSNVIVEACEKALELKLPNVRFANCSAENLLHFFDANSVEKIYLNFSCPFPKKTYANRRLTCQKMLKIYDILLCDGGEIVQKTDNREFFEFSLEQYALFGFDAYHVTQDLHGSEHYLDNIVTEYESKFIADELPIFAAKIRRKN